MPDKGSKNKKFEKPVKRIVNFSILPKAPFAKRLPTVFSVTYILDSGNLLENIRLKYTETVKCYNLDAVDTKEKYLMRSIERLHKDLEKAIRATGATEANVKAVLDQLLKSR